jgi:hypothetical protein
MLRKEYGSGIRQTVLANISQRIDHYLSVYPRLDPTVSIRTVWNEQFNVKEILETHEGYVIFAYYSKEKSVPLQKH